MYLPKSFEEDRLPVLHDAIRAAGLATLVTVTAAGPVASHIPMLLDAGPGERGTLLARPEAIMVDVKGEGYPGRVRRVAYLGPIVEYEVEVPGTALVLTQYDPRQVYAVGTEVRVRLVEEALYLLPKE